MTHLKHFLIILLGSLFLFSACENSLEEVKEVSEKLEYNIETARGVELYYSEQGAVKVHLKAPILLRHKTEEPFSEFPEGLDVTFFDAEQNKSGTLTSKYGIRNEKTKLVTVSDSVVWENQKEQRRFESEEMNWDENKAKIFTDKFVKISSPTGIIFGEAGFEANQDFSKLKIKEVKGQIAPNEIIGDE